MALAPERIKLLIRIIALILAAGVVWFLVRFYR